MEYTCNNCRKLIYDKTDLVRVDYKNMWLAYFCEKCFKEVAPTIHDDWLFEYYRKELIF